ncbi:hypothetical protein [Gilvimarinus agarilyticus]|uniref:hypothetical protein n=1 Tax=Gilvimarinus agarilyticus TaxID=679259 RepID=UPI0005A01C65|nr:hypothetical protein [Gilvimarinus agarilyticus]
MDTQTTEEITQALTNMPNTTRHCCLVVAKMISAGMMKEGMDVPGNIEYLRSNLIGSEEDKRFQVAQTIKFYEQLNTKAV